MHARGLLMSLGSRDVCVSHEPFRLFLQMVDRLCGRVAAAISSLVCSRART
ncbi:hypothetical protein ACTMTI_34100 [Nonomuraea sp. H19]|uniref:hypothetical protein n=1 Tax=Nonomuraea sp. H19 TaxID=3452206 RepID=UPI003F8A358F